MYEHWTQVNWDLALSPSRMLEYNMDTYGGESGAPVLEAGHGPLSALGVHCYGPGSTPNEASVIGKAGNKFQDLIEAMKIKERASTNPTKSPSTKHGLSTNLPNFAIIAAQAGDTTKHPGPVNGKPDGNKVAEGTFMAYPEVIQMPESVKNEKNIDETLVDKALEDKQSRAEIEPKTVLFLNIKQPFQGEDLKKLQMLSTHIRNWQCWASTAVETKIQQLINAKKLSASTDIASVAKLTDSRSKLWDYVIRTKSTWFTVNAAQMVRSYIPRVMIVLQANVFTQQSKHLSCYMAEFHTGLISAVVEGLLVPPSILGQLHKVVSDLKESVLKFSAGGKEQTAQFWIMITTYQYLEEMGTVEPSIRLISFRSTNKTYEVTAGKNQFKKVEFDLEYTSSKAAFNDDIYSAVFEGMKADLIEKGRKLTQDSALDFDPTA